MKVKTYKLVDTRNGGNVIARNLTKRLVKNIITEYSNMILCDDNPLPFLDVVEEQVIHVIFRKTSDGEIVAFFPYRLNPNSPIIRFSCYSHIGQHSECVYSYYRETKPATHDEYVDLKNELENFVGYDLKVIKKINNNIWKEALTTICLGY